MGRGDAASRSTGRRACCRTRACARSNAGIGKKQGNRGCGRCKVATYCIKTHRTVHVSAHEGLCEELRLHRYLARESRVWPVQGGDVMQQGAQDDARFGARGPVRGVARVSVDRGGFEERSGVVYARWRRTAARRTGRRTCWRTRVCARSCAGIGRQGGIRG
jgi:hypothetical protein